MRLRETLAASTILLLGVSCENSPSRNNLRQNEPLTIATHEEVIEPVCSDQNDSKTNAELIYTRLHTDLYVGYRNDYIKILNACSSQDFIHALLYSNVLLNEAEATEGTEMEQAEILATRTYIERVGLELEKIEGEQTFFNTIPASGNYLKILE